MSTDPLAQPVALHADPATGEVRASAEGDPPALHQPGRYATPILWFVIVGSFALVMVAAALTLMIEFLVPGVESKKVEAAIILLLFSTPAAFLSGLVIPSPFQHH